MSNVLNMNGNIGFGMLNPSAKLEVYGTQKYNILGEEVELNLYNDSVQMICMINVLGKPYYDQLKINKVHIPKDLDTILVRIFRDIAINKIITE